MCLTHYSFCSEKIKTFKSSWIIVHSLISSLAQNTKKTKKMEECNYISAAIGRKLLSYRCDNVRDQIGEGNEQIIHCANQCIEKDLKEILHLATF